MRCRPGCPSDQSLPLHPKVGVPTQNPIFVVSAVFATLGFYSPSRLKLVAVSTCDAVTVTVTSSPTAAPAFVTAPITPDVDHDSEWLGIPDETGRQARAAEWLEMRSPKLPW